MGGDTMYPPTNRKEAADEPRRRLEALGANGPVLCADDSDSRMADLLGLSLNPAPHKNRTEGGNTVQREQKIQNVGTPERWLRVIGGAVLVLIGLAYLLAGPGSVFALVLGLIFILLGADFIFTGITGYCPLYNRLGWSTARTGGGPKRERPRPR